MCRVCEVRECVCGVWEGVCVRASLSGVPDIECVYRRHDTSLLSLILFFYVDMHNVHGIL